jgi:hypothetical protein
MFANSSNTLCVVISRDFYLGEDISMYSILALGCPSSPGFFQLHPRTRCVDNELTRRIVSRSSPNRLEST